MSDAGPADDTSTDPTPAGSTGAAPSADSAASPEPGGIAEGTYELLRRRLEAAATELRRRADALNERRLETFGASRLELVTTERVRTELNTVPRDLVSVGAEMIMGYNAEVGVRSEIRPEDVFAVHHLEAGADDGLWFSPNAEGLAGSVLDDDQFRRDLIELHTYFSQTRLQQLHRTGNRLLAVFRTGAGAGDIRVLRWEIGLDHDLTYLDARGERDHRYPPHHDVEWTLVTRADHVDDRHVDLGARVLAAPLGGSFDLRLDDGGDAGAGTLLLSDPVDHHDQSLQDCTIRTARAGDLVLVDLLPYGEQTHRYYVVNLLAAAAVRLDALGAAFRQLPDDQGLIFPDGIYLRTGELRRFDVDAAGTELLDVVRSPNGEDVLYVFHERTSGRSILLAYNVVRQEVAAPIWCHGHTIFDDGTLVVFREEPEPTRIHPIQIWATPFASDEWFDAQPRNESELDRIGNAALVSGIAEALALTRLIADVEPSTEVYGDLLASAGRFIDAHHWSSDESVGNLAASAHEIRVAAEAVIDEFERVQEVADAAERALAEAEGSLTSLLEDLRLSPPSTTTGFIDGLAAIRREIGHLHTERDRRGIDVVRIDELLTRATEANEALAQRAADHLADDDAFATFAERLDEIDRSVPAVTASVDADRLLDEIDEVGTQLDLVADTVGDLVVDDPRVRTAVLSQVSGVLAESNRVRAAVDARRTLLLEQETGAAFATELGLLGQSVATAVARADDPEACDDALGRLLLQLEQLEMAASRTEAQLDEIEARREQITETLTAKRQQLTDARQQRTDRLVEAATRSLDRMTERAGTLPDADAVHGFFAADPVAARTRRLIDDLRELGDSVRADELASDLGARRDRALRDLRDRSELFDGDAVALGRHRFSVDDRRRELTLVPSGDHLDAVLTGTDLRFPVLDPTLDAHRDRWDQPVASESPTVPRALYLAGVLALDRLARPDDVGGADGDGMPTNDDATAADRWLTVVHDALDTRIDEGYDRGVHDRDAARLLAALVPVARAAGTLVTPPRARLAAQLAWASFDEPIRERWRRRGLAVVAGGADLTPDVRIELTEALADDIAVGVPAGLLAVDPAVAAPALLDELVLGGPSFAVADEVARIAERLDGPRVADVREATADDLVGRVGVLGGLVRSLDPDLPTDVADEVALVLALPHLDRRRVEVDLEVTVDGLSSTHPTIADGSLTVRVDRALAAVAHHRDEVVPAHREFAAARHGAIERLRSELRLDDLEPRVPDGFVRNRLIDRVYLPLIGDNLARQIGTADDRSGQRSGLLMLLSPPGYGKTTLVEYVAQRLGMALVKVSGPGLGHDVTALDPARAPSATAARELERINLAFAIGTNVMLYLDDIQHTNPEFLQRFISLCDAQRRVEGVWRGESRTFDLRGKRFAVVMAGNPYTESGERFRIPDMLANRADTYNLGDVVGDDEATFARSYLENALSANPVTAPLVGRSRDDLDRFLAAADGGTLDESSLEHGYGSAEADEIVRTLRHLRRIQDVVLTVNRRYIASAATEDAYRTEPPFLLQGSYRNMARMASKVVPVMRDDEVEALIDEHYEAESQTLTGAAEANRLKLGELRGTLDDDETARWDEIRESFRRRQRLGGDERDAATRVVAAIGEVADALRSPD